MKARLSCPYCSGSIDHIGKSYACHPCKREFPVVEDIPCFAGPNIKVEGKTELPGLSGTHEEESQISWQEALIKKAARSESALEFLENAVSPCAASPWVLARLERRCDALDLGCGWGGTAFALARVFASVVCCDANLEKLKLARLRAQQESTRNISFVLAGNTPLLPFEKQQFDLILLRIDQSGPSRVQDLLALSMTLLTPGGQVVFFVPNRWNSWRQRITGRHKASVSGNRAHSTSLRGHRSQLAAAGFRETRHLLAFPSQHSLRALIDPRIHRSALGYFEELEPARSGSFRLRSKAILSSILAPDFCWIAGREKEQKSFLERLGAHVLCSVAPGAVPEIVCRRFRVTRREVVTCELQLDHARANVIAKIPLSHEGEVRASQEHTILSSVFARLDAPKKWTEIPQPLLAGEFEGTPFFVQQAKQGFPGLGFLGRSKGAVNWREKALEFLLRMHGITVTRRSLDEKVWAEKVLPHLTPGLLATQEHANISAEKIEDCLKANLLGLVLPFIFRHGDYWPGNLLFDRAGARITGVIDWDRAQPDSLPLLDLLDALISGRAEEEATSTPKLFDRLIHEGMSRDDLKLIEMYQTEMDFSLSAKQLQMFLLMDWLIRVSMRVSPQYAAWWGEYDWVRSNVPASEARIREACGF
ncbi:MAG: phosphotransferase [Candidatus Acidiferrales bacterium]